MQQCFLWRDSRSFGPVSRFTVGFIPRSFPVSLLELSAPPVSLAGSLPVPVRLFLIMLIKEDSRDVRKCAEKNIPVCVTPPILQVVIRPFFTPEINPDPRRNRERGAQKPATESTSAQGLAESEELSFPDQNCKSAGFTLSDSLCNYPGPGPTFLPVLSRKYHPGRYKTGEMDQKPA